MDDRDLARVLRQWTAEGRAERAKSDRERTRRIRQMASELATFSGLLLDLFERGSLVSISTSSRHICSGSIAAIGRDFVAIQPGERPIVILALSAVTSAQVTGRSRSAIAPSDRRLDGSEPDLAGILADLAVERARVRIMFDQGDTAAGEILAVGEDVVTLVRDGYHDPENQTIFVPLSKINELSLVD